MTTVVISQPMLFPWVGMFEQIRQADVFVHYADVAFSKGSFVNRVQLKTATGWEWMTIPLVSRQLGDLIQDLVADDSEDWRRRHLQRLAELYRPAQYSEEMLELVRSVYDRSYSRLSDLLIASCDAVCEYFGLARQTRFLHSTELAIAGNSSQRVLNIVRHFDGTRYVTGHGAKNYLDHEAFEAAGIAVEYLDYRRLPYPQLHGPFNPHVSILDLIANCGRGGIKFIISPTQSWREMT